ncbi:MAG: phospholipase [Planctomycetes bacterium]|nr:phospholipase [Planctomycetota bacterium]
MNHESQILAGLSCRIVDALPAGASPHLVAILCHGFGAPGTDLVSVASELVLLRPELADAVRFVFPAAPLRLDDVGMPGGRAWWMIDLDRLNAAMQRGELLDMRRETPEGLAEARARLMDLVHAVCERMSVATAQVVLGGFSQGAMLSTDVTLRLEDAPAALCIWSGTLLCEDDWRRLAPRRRGMPVLQSHGRNDPLLPFAAAESLRDLLQEAGLQVEFLPFGGLHEIPREALRRFAELLMQLRASGA